MSFTYGFYNSLKGDRKYNAEQVSEIFDGILKDGIIPSQGQLFVVKSAENGMQITVGTGRAWFNHTWSKNDSVMVLTVPQSDITRPRYDAVVLEVNHNDMVRANSIKIVQGESAVNPVKPILVTTDKIWQYPLAYILVPAAASEIKAENIENMVGRTPTVFATGVLETVAIDDLWSQWEGEWRTWFEGIKLQLSGDIVTNLQYQIDQLKDQFLDFQETFGVKMVEHTDIITATRTWTNPTEKELDVTLLMFGGGGAGVDYKTGSTGHVSGGGGGHMASGTVKVKASETLTVTIGKGGVYSSSSATGSAGGTTSFGSYMSALGGSGGYYGDGGSGGTGGGGGVSSMTSHCGNGGNGSYGGGGGGCCGGNGGNGGSYGGGGGGGGGYTSDNLGSGGIGGTHGGNGGNAKSSGTGGQGANGVDTSGTSLEFKGTGLGGAGGTADYNFYTCTGGGGGGYGGNGGAGLIGGDSNSGGGGGGGYGGNGGAGGRYSSGTSGDVYGGGGGGGYGGNAVPSVAVYSGSTWLGSCGGGGGGYGAGNYGAGGPAGKSGTNGICVVRYYTKEVVPL